MCSFRTGEIFLLIRVAQICSPFYERNHASYWTKPDAFVRKRISSSLLVRHCKNSLELQYLEQENITKNKFNQRRFGHHLVIIQFFSRKRSLFFCSISLYSLLKLDGEFTMAHPNWGGSMWPVEEAVSLRNVFNSTSCFLFHTLYYILMERENIAPFWGV